MLLKHRPPAIDTTTITPRPGLEHVERAAIAVLRWLNDHKLDYIVVGPVGHAIRGDRAARGPVAIVPAPYDRNYDRLARALTAEHAGLRSERGLTTSPGDAAVAVKFTGEKLARGRRWMVRVTGCDLDIERAAPREGAPGDAEASGAPGGAEQAATGGEAGARYQELLYEAHRFELMDGVSVQVASPEDLEHYSHMRRTGSAPEFRITRTATSAEAEGEAESEAHDAESRSGGRPDD